MRHVLVSLAAVAIVAAGCTTKEGPTLDYTPEFSLLTEEGVNQIKDSRHARFDLRDLQLTKADTGVEPKYDLGPLIGDASGPELTLELLGPTGTETVTTRMFAVESFAKDKPYAGITFWRDFDNPADANAELLDGIQRWGFHPDQVSTWLDNTRDGQDDKSVISMGIGPAGLVNEVEARLKNGHTLLRYMIQLDPDLYTPETLTNIREFGTDTRPPGR